MKLSGFSSCYPCSKSSANIFFKQVKKKKIHVWNQVISLTVWNCKKKKNSRYFFPCVKLKLFSKFMCKTKWFFCFSCKKENYFTMCEKKKISRKCYFHRCKKKPIKEPANYPSKTFFLFFHQISSHRTEDNLDKTCSPLKTIS